MGVRGRGRRRAAVWQADLDGRRRARLRRRGQGRAPARAPHVRRRDLDPAGRARGVAERQRRGRAAALRGGASAAGGEQRLRRRIDVAEPTLYLFDGYNLLHAGGFDGVPRARRRARQLRRRCRALAASSSSTASGADEPTSARSSVRFAPHADALLERLAAEHRGGERVCLVSSDAAVRGTSGQEVSQAELGDVPARPRRRPRMEGGASRSAPTVSTPRRERGSSGSAAARLTTRTHVRITYGPLQSSCTLRRVVLLSASTSG